MGAIGNFEIKALQEMYKNDLWETCLYDKNKNLAKHLMRFINNHLLSWKEVCYELDYSYINAFPNEYMSTHFRRVLVELKLLSIYGDHCWKHFGGGNAS